MLARQTPGGESRPVPIGSRLIGVSLRPAIPRRVAPQQSPPPLHQSATIVAEPATPIKCEARPHRCHLGCHLYFARRVTFLSSADTPMTAYLESMKNATYGGPAPAETPKTVIAA